jgi:hypothetical protein
MPSRSKKLKGVSFNPGDVVNISKMSPYVQRLVQDAKLRDNVRTAFDSSKSAYTRLTNGKTPAKALLDDKKLQRDLQKAAEAAREAAAALSEGPKKRARKGLSFGRKVMIVGLGAGLAVAGSEKLRSKVLDTLFGAEEEFEYTPPPSTSSSQQTAPVSAA